MLYTMLSVICDTSDDILKMNHKHVLAECAREQLNLGLFHNGTYSVGQKKFKDQMFYSCF